jgi:hypothetical protein
MTPEPIHTSRFRLPSPPCVRARHTSHTPRTCLYLLLGVLLGVLTYPRVCPSAPYEITMGSAYEYDKNKGGRNNIMAGLDDEHCLCLYRGFVGRAVVLEVNPQDWSLAATSYLEYDTNGDYMGLAGIDATHFFCTYCGEGEVACASVLTVDPADWSMTKETTIVYDTEFGYYNALSRIDDTHYLGVHNMWDVTGRAGVFTIDPADWSIAYGSECAFEPESGFDFMLSRIDSTHHLCVYPSQATGYTGRAVVLIVDPETWTVRTEAAPFTFATDCDCYSFVSRIDDSHFLCVYQGPDSHGWAVVLTIDAADWSISMETPFEYDEGLGGEPNVTKIDDTHYLCVYKGVDADGFAVVLSVDLGDWSISKEWPFEFDTVRADYPYLCRIDEGHYLCSWEGPDLDGWAAVLEVELPAVGIVQETSAGSGLDLCIHPNPFNPQTVIDFVLPADGKVELSIYSIDGRRVAALVDGFLTSGPHSFRWDGRDSHGKRVSSGVYCCRLNVGDDLEVKRMTFVR